ncbi:MAG: precorrin-6A/cobalt-precorrin-6A reductase [Pseudomonadota bacterium]
MVRILILGSSARAADAAHALMQSNAKVRIYWSRAVAADDVSCVASMRDGLDWADAVVDMTHAFDSDLRDMARAIAPDLPSLRYARPLWTAQQGDTWATVQSLGQAVGLLPAGARVFAATGRESAEILAHHDAPVFLRQLQHHDDATSGQVQYVFGAGPFDVPAEVALFQRLKIDILLARNVGGAGSYPKITAARQIGLPVVMVQPDLSAVKETTTDIATVLSWAEGIACG